ncbi:DUF3224 domain-containing protein [Streptomyces sp. NPDC048516]|uniref:DUF3224 domain-containing protein n=1 Tax=Streptomyces sp. NPDC048516 TaxID=3365565 RepID=UPI00371F6A78
MHGRNATPPPASLRRIIGLAGSTDVSGTEYDPGRRASGTFKVADFTPAPVPSPAIETAVPVGLATMDKQYEGEVVGRSATLFTAAFDQPTGTGTYLAMESFEGALHGRSGAFNFAHSATTLGEGRQGEFFVIVPGSGTGELIGITGAGGIAVDADGTHRIWFDYDVCIGPVMLWGPTVLALTYAYYKRRQPA